MVSLTDENDSADAPSFALRTPLYHGCELNVLRRGILAASVGDARRYVPMRRILSQTAEQHHAHHDSEKKTCRDTDINPEPLLVA